MGTSSQEPKSHCKISLHGLLHNYQTQWFLIEEQFLLPRKHLAICRNIFGCHNWEREKYYLNIVGRGQVFWQTFYNAQESPPQQRIIGAKKSIVLQLGNSNQRITSKLVYNSNKSSYHSSYLFCIGYKLEATHLGSTCVLVDSPLLLDASDAFRCATSSTTCYCLHPAVFTYSCFPLT